MGEWTVILKSIKVMNYKSFRRNQNVLLIERNVTTLIGKNESGKSNLLEVIGKVSLINGMSNDVFASWNRKDELGKVGISLDICFTDKEADELGLENKETRFIMDESQKVKIEGALSDYFKQLKTLKLVNELKEAYANNLMGLDNNVKNAFSSYLIAFEQLGSSICSNYMNIIQTIKIWSKNVKDENIRIHIENTVQELHQIIELAYSKFPVFHYYNETKIENAYLINEDLIKKFDLSDTPFKRLLSASKIDISEMQKSFSNNAGISQDMRELIQGKIKENIEKKFAKFYTQEKVQITPRFNNNYFSIMIKTSPANMQVSERSNGLQWYFNLFIDILAHDFQDKNVIYLIDEPGVYLHVEAQKELLSLFKELTKVKNQVLYTTHSPYMLDTGNVLQVRALEKVDGDTYICNSIYSLRQNSTSRLETLSPLLNALGLDLKHNIGPSITKRNLIVEGITDYMYITAMLNYLSIDDFYVIPSVGAGNIDKIASILFGWGYDYKIILDHDNAGNGQAQKLEKGFGFELNKDYFYVNGASQYDKGISYTIEDLISSEDNEKLQCRYDKTNSEATKKLAARNFFDMVNSGELISSKDTETNFNKLFDLLKL